MMLDRDYGLKAHRSFMRLIAGLALLAGIGQAAASTITYYHNDLVGSPVAATNASGQVIWRESYRPYGERLKNEAAASNDDIWFTSRRQDSTGLVYMGARYYDPVVGRFMSTDPKGFDEANLHSHHRYAYANNNPYKYVDPDGCAAILLAPLMAPALAKATTAISTLALGSALFGYNILNESNKNDASKPDASSAGAGNSASLPPDGDDKGPQKGDLRAVKERKLENDGIDAHRLKKDYVYDQGGKYNISVETGSGEVYLTPVRGGLVNPYRPG